MGDDVWTMFGPSPLPPRPSLVVKKGSKIGAGRHRRADSVVGDGQYRFGQRVGIRPRGLFGSDADGAAVRAAFEAYAAARW